MRSQLDLFLGARRIRNLGGDRFDPLGGWGDRESGIDHASPHLKHRQPRRRISIDGHRLTLLVKRLVCGTHTVEIDGVGIDLSRRSGLVGQWIHLALG
jgi:hypothetical protein